MSDSSASAKSTAQEDVPDYRRFTYTLHYLRPMLAAAKEEATEGRMRAIDVGCGEGIASRELADDGWSVTGIDSDDDSIRRAKRRGPAEINFVLGDVHDTELEPADLVVAAAMLHHGEISAGLTRLRELVAPGGRLVVVGMARNTWRDIPLEIGASIADKAFAFAKGARWDSGAPCVWPAPHSYPQVRAAVAKILPGATYRQRLLYRYTIDWTAPAA